MRFSTLTVIFASMLCLLGNLAASAQEPNPAYDSRFVRARSFEADQPLRAIEAYSTVKNHARNRELEADALLRATLLGYATVTRQSSDLNHLSGPARAERATVQLQVAQQGHDAVKQLFDQYPDTKAGAYAMDTHWGKDGGQNLREALESEIDIRNSHNPSYQAVDFLVRLTGGSPAFSYWFALLLIACIVKGLTFPLTLKMYRSQREMKAIQPQVEALRVKYKGNTVEMNEKMMALYKENGVNPAASCVPMLVQLPFMYWVYNIIRLYEFHFANGKFLWIGSPMARHYRDILASNLAQFDVPLLCIYTASNYLTMYLTPASDPQQAQTQRSMSIMTSVMMFFMFLKFKWSAAFIFYWIVLNLLSAAQTYWFVYRPNRNGSGSVLTLKATEASSAPPVRSTGVVGSVPVVPTPIPNSGMRSRPKRKRR